MVVLVREEVVLSVVVLLDPSSIATVSASALVPIEVLIVLVGCCVVAMVNRMIGE